MVDASCRRKLSFSATSCATRFFRAATSAHSVELISPGTLATLSDGLAREADSLVPALGFFCAAAFRAASIRAFNSSLRLSKSSFRMASIVSACSGHGGPSAINIKGKGTTSEIDRIVVENVDAESKNMPILHGDLSRSPCFSMEDWRSTAPATCARC